MWARIDHWAAHHSEPVVVDGPALSFFQGFVPRNIGIHTLRTRAMTSGRPGLDGGGSEVLDPLSTQAAGDPWELGVRPYILGMRGPYIRPEASSRRWLGWAGGGVEVPGPFGMTARGALKIRGRDRGEALRGRDVRPVDWALEPLAR